MDRGRALALDQWKPLNVVSRTICVTIAFLSFDGAKLQTFVLSAQAYALLARVCVTAQILGFPCRYNLFS